MISVFTNKDFVRDNEQVKSIKHLQSANECNKITQAVSKMEGNLGGAPGTQPPPPHTHGPKISQFHAVFRKFWQNLMLAPPGRLVFPPTRNPGSAPGPLPYS